MEYLPKRTSLVHETAAAVKNWIETGLLSGRLPGELQLKKRLGVGRDTLRLALQLLEKEGRVTPTIQGRQRQVLGAHLPALPVSASRLPVSFISPYSVVDRIVLLEGGRISALMPRAELPRAIDIDVLSDGLWLAPGFIDLQVNGGGDVLFNDAPTPEGIAAIAAAHRKFGTTGLLPTLITDTAEKMRAALAAVQTVRGQHPSVLGIHFEGPFLSPDRPGVHCVRHIRAPSAADIDMLTAARAGAMLITLAPEQVPAELVSLSETAWPYGRVVLVTQAASTNTSEQGKAKLRENRGLLMGTLKELVVQIREAP